MILDVASRNTRKAIEQNLSEKQTSMKTEVTCEF